MKNSLTPNTTRNTKAIVHNFSNHALTDEEKMVLSKGFNFAVTPRTFPREEIIANIEAMLNDIRFSRIVECVFGIPGVYPFKR